MSVPAGVLEQISDTVVLGELAIPAIFAGLVAILSTIAVERLGGTMGGVLSSIPTTIVPAAVGIWGAGDDLDGFRRAVDQSGAMDGLDAYNQQAFGILTSSRLVEALDLKKEDPKLVERYGKGDPRNRDDGGPKLMEHFLMARRLVEAGARCVTLAFSRWDHHGDNFGALRQDLPLLDRGLSALLEDLHQRGLENDVSVVVWGEFGRTPTINKDGGRDHWPRVTCALLAGGGLRHGQVIGSTDRLGGEAASRPVQFGEIHATMYQALGIDVNKVTLPDLTGRPQFLVPDGCQPLREMV